MLTFTSLSSITAIHLNFTPSEQKHTLIDYSLRVPYIHRLSTPSLTDKQKRHTYVSEYQAARLIAHTPATKPDW